MRQCQESNSINMSVSNKNFKHFGKRRIWLEVKIAYKKLYHFCMVFLRDLFKPWLILISKILPPRRQRFFNLNLPVALAIA